VRILTGFLSTDSFTVFGTGSHPGTVVASDPFAGLPFYGVDLILTFSEGTYSDASLPTALPNVADAQVYWAITTFLDSGHLEYSKSQRVGNA
jgi:hypothetical protein